MLCRLHAHSQYAQLFRYGSGVEQSITAEEPKEKSTRWSSLPWYLRSELSLHDKRLIAQLRQGGIYIRCNGTAVSIPHGKEEMQCTFCNLRDVDCPQHALFECPITAVTSLSLQKHGWKLAEYMEFLDKPWGKPQEIRELIMQCIRTRQLIRSEASNQI